MKQQAFHTSHYPITGISRESLLIFCLKNVQSSGSKATFDIVCRGPLSATKFPLFAGYNIYSSLSLPFSLYLFLFLKQFRLTLL